MSGPLGGHPLSYDSMADPDLQIRNRGPAGHPRPEIRGGGGGGLQKKFFRLLGPQFGLKIRGDPGPPGSAIPFLANDHLL